MVPPFRLQCHARGRFWLKPSVCTVLSPGPPLKPPSAVVRCTVVRTHIIYRRRGSAKTVLASGRGEGLRPFSPDLLGFGLGTSGSPHPRHRLAFGALIPSLFLTRHSLGAIPRLSGKGGLSWLPEGRRSERVGLEPGRVSRGSWRSTSLRGSGVELGQIPRSFAEQVVTHAVRLCWGIPRRSASQ
jgi:hypothetical protein